GPMWYQQDGAIQEDPRVFVYATLGAASFTGGSGCEVAVSPGEVYPYTPGSGWRYVGLEYVAGRPSHHVMCDGELWIDTATRVTWRSRGPVLDAGGRPIEGRSRTVEVTRLRFGQPDPALFEIKPPEGAQTLDDAQH